MPCVPSSAPCPCLQQYSVVFSDDASGAKLPCLSRDGHGTARYANGDSYCGEYLQRRRHGSGVYTFRNGCSYSGGWQQGVRHGEGSMSYPDKGRYAGCWAAGKRDGYGVYSYSNGDRYSGGWVADRKQGKGVYAFAKSGEEVQGEWSNGRLTSGVWQQRGARVIGNFRQQQPFGLSLVVNARGQAAAGQYTDSNLFLPLAPASSLSLPSSSSPAAASSPPAVVAPSAPTVAARMLENCVLSLSHCEGVYRLLRTVPGAPNFRRLGESAVFVSGQPSVEGARAAVAAARDAANAERVVWLDAREELLLYVGDRGFTPRHPKRASLPLPLPQLTVQEAEALEASYALRLQQRIAHKGGLLAYVKETYADLPLDRRCLQSQDDVSGAAVRSSRQIFTALAEDDGLPVEYARLPPLQDVDGLCSALRPVLADAAAAVVISDWMGKETATWVAVLALLLIKLRDGGLEQDEAEAESDGKEAAEDGQPEKDGEEKADEQQEETQQEEPDAQEEEEKQQDEHEDEQEKEQEEQEEEQAAEEEKQAPAAAESGEDGAGEPAAAAESAPVDGSEAQNEAQQGSSGGAEAAAADSPPAAASAEATATEVVPADAAAAIPSAAADASPAAAAPPAPLPLTAEEKARLMRGGSYAAVSRLLSLLGAEGVKAKAAVDAAADAAAGMLNVRECVRWAFEQWEAEAEAERAGDRGRLWLRLGRDWLQRYCSLITLTVWLRQDAAASRKAQAAAAAADAEEEAAEDSSEQAASLRFSDWLAARPDVTTAMTEELQAFVFNV